MQTSIFGDYFIAEIISSQSQGKICLVAENENHKAVGMLVASREVNYEPIMSYYDLAEHNYMTKDDYYPSYLMLKEV